MHFGDAIQTVGEAVEAVGVGVIVLSVLVSLGALVRSIAPRGDRPGANVEARRSVGQGILLGLEVLVAGDIIRTVGVDPSFRSVGILSVIVLIRTFLSFTIGAEVTGRWPWQHDRPSQSPRSSRTMGPSRNGAGAHV
jgi:uncharacterized membrane protein